VIKLCKHMHVYNELHSKTKHSKHFIENHSFTHRNVICRVDWNVPVNASGVIQDDYRITSSLRTINCILKDRPNKVVLVSHFGRPDSKLPPSEWSKSNNSWSRYLSQLAKVSLVLVAVEVACHFTLLITYACYSLFFIIHAALPRRDPALPAQGPLSHASLLCLSLKPLSYASITPPILPCCSYSFTQHFPGETLHFLPKGLHPDTLAEIKSSPDRLFLLENIRFHKEETEFENLGVEKLADSEPYKVCLCVF
jgi:hypothetical protein